MYLWAKLLLFQQSGTLSSSQLDHSAPPSVPVVQQKQRKGRRRLNTSLSDDYSDVVSKVHQDDEYSKLAFLALYNKL